MEPSESNRCWSEATGFGIPELDAADRRLVGLAQVVNQAIADGRDGKEIRRLMKLLVSEAVGHFELEERILAERAYPAAMGHAALHLQMKAELEHAMEALADAGARAMWAEYGLLVTQLVVDHFRQETSKFRGFLRTGSMPDSPGM